MGRGDGELPLVLRFAPVLGCILVLDMATQLDDKNLRSIRHQLVRRHSGTDSHHGIGLCECGCGEKTRLAPHDRKEAGWIKGQPLRFILGHAMRTYGRPPLDLEDYALEDRGYATTCWIRRGYRTTVGYTKVSIAGRTMYAHRAMYEQEVGAIPAGLHIDHLCDQRDCINPAHLEPKSQAQNLWRGRHVKLTPEKVRAIRKAEGMTKDIAVDFGISQSHCSRVRRGIRWAWAELPD